MANRRRTFLCEPRTPRLEVSQGLRAPTCTMERSVEVATGESVKFSYELAGLGSRFFAVFIDLTIQISVLVLSVLLLAWVGATSPTPAHAPAVSTSMAKIAQAILIALLVLALFMLFVGYFIIFEWRWNGRTPGKRLLGIRVVRDGGFPVDFTAAVIRNVVRIFEASFGFPRSASLVDVEQPPSHVRHAATTIRTRATRILINALRTTTLRLKSRDDARIEPSCQSAGRYRTRKARRRWLRNPSPPLARPKPPPACGGRVGRGLAHQLPVDSLTMTGRRMTMNSTGKMQIIIGTESLTGRL